MHEVDLDGSKHRQRMSRAAMRLDLFLYAVIVIALYVVLGVWP
jgi:hypothetical protein